jgi:hypothetical protein
MYQNPKSEIRNQNDTLAQAAKLRIYQSSKSPIQSFDGYPENMPVTESVNLASQHHQPRCPNSQEHKFT